MSTNGAKLNNKLKIFAKYTEQECQTFKAHSKVDLKTLNHKQYHDLDRFMRKLDDLHRLARLCQEQNSPPPQITKAINQVAGIFTAWRSNNNAPMLAELSEYAENTLGKKSVDKENVDDDRFCQFQMDL